MIKHKNILSGIVFMTCAAAIVVHSHLSTHDIVYLPVDKAHEEQESVACEAAPEEVSNVLVVNFKKGDTLGKLLRENNITAQESEKIIKAIKRQIGTVTFQVGQELIIEFTLNSQQKDFSKLVFQHLTDSEISVTKQDGNMYHAEKKVFELTRDVRYLSGALDCSFNESARKNGVPGKLIRLADGYLGAVSRKNSPRNTSDQFQFLYDVYLDKNGKIVKSGQIIYLSIRHKNKNHQLFGFALNGTKVDYFNQDGECLSERKGLVRPICGKVTITSPFNMQGRWHPVMGYKRPHLGVDFGARHGTPVVAAADGVVTQAGYFGAHGNTITITHHGGYKTVYAHLSKMNVRRGQYIKQRQHIGNVGSTGLSTGAHLHFEVIVNNRHVNPLSVTKMPVYHLTGRDLNRFKQAIYQISQTVKNKEIPTVLVTGGRSKPRL